MQFYTQCGVIVSFCNDFKENPHSKVQRGITRQNAANQCPHYLQSFRKLSKVWDKQGKNNVSSLKLKRWSIVLTVTMEFQPTNCWKFTWFLVNYQDKNELQLVKCDQWYLWFHSVPSLDPTSLQLVPHNEKWSDVHWHFYDWNRINLLHEIFWKIIIHVIHMNLWKQKNTKAKQKYTTNFDTTF